MSNYNKIQQMVKSNDATERIEAINQIRLNFDDFINKEQVTRELLKLINDEDKLVQGTAVYALGDIFLHVTDKKQASKELFKLKKDENSLIRMNLASTIYRAFAYITDKEQATNILLEFTKDKDSSVRWDAIYAISRAFAHLTDKEQAMKELLTLTNDRNNLIREVTTKALGVAIAFVADKEQATRRLLELTKDDDKFVRWEAAEALGTSFKYIVNKEYATKNLMELTKDEDSSVRGGAAGALGIAFAYLTDKKQATKDFLELTRDEDSYVRRNVARALGQAFKYVTEKEQATKDLIALTRDENTEVRWHATSALGPAFQYITNKEQAWNDLLTLTKDEDRSVRYAASLALGFAFQHVTDKNQATKDLLILTKDKDSSVRWGAAGALGLAFQYMTDKEQAWNDLLVFTKDDDGNVKASAYHSMGKISIYRATNAENDEKFKEELEKAIDYFEKALQESVHINPVKFCLPFYRSYHAVIFRQHEAENVVEKNLEEAKQAVEGSETKEKLLEIIGNISNALTEAYKLRDLNEIQSDLGTIMQYCNRVDELLQSTKENAPNATRLINKGLSIIEKTINDIQEKASALCVKAKNTGTESLACQTNILANELSPTNEQKNEEIISEIIILLTELCNKLPVNKKGNICESFESLEEKEESEKLKIIFKVLTHLVSNFPDQVSLPNIFLQILVTSFTISGGFYTISNAILDYMNYSTTKRESLIIFFATFLSTSILSFTGYKLQWEFFKRISKLWESFLRFCQIFIDMIATYYENFSTIYYEHKKTMKSILLFSLSVIFFLSLLYLIAILYSFNQASLTYPVPHKTNIGDTDIPLEYPWGNQSNLTVFINLDNVPINEQKYYTDAVLLAMKWWERDEIHNLSYDVNITLTNNSTDANIIFKWEEYGKDVRGHTHINSTDNFEEFKSCDTYNLPYTQCNITIIPNLDYEENLHVIKHEFGHALGLEHSFNKSDFLILFLGLNPNYLLSPSEIMFDGTVYTKVYEFINKILILEILIIGVTAIIFTLIAYFIRKRK